MLFRSLPTVDFIDYAALTDDNPLDGMIFIMSRLPLPRNFTYRRSDVHFLCGTKLFDYFKRLFTELAEEANTGRRCLTATLKLKLKQLKYLRYQNEKY